MKHLIVEKYPLLNIILERFFKLNYTRHSIPEIHPHDELDIFDLACKIYKRGFITQPAQHCISIQNTNECYYIVDSNFINNFP
ncbi:MAG: hypothetical protein V4591_12080, partial [Bdellovibrionota bacterium]